MDSSIGVATVYRLMNILEEIGAISRKSVYTMTCMKENCQQMMDYHEIIECIAGALDAKDSYTAGHSQRVSELALLVCELMQLTPEETERIHIAAHLHDIGKIGIRDAVLNKEGKLTEEEWLEMRRHPQIGAEILNRSSHLSELKDIVLYHHERYDGRGYPKGLKGKEIPLGSRIIAICDSIDAMTSNRSYRRAHSHEYCKKELEKNIGIMYDPCISRLVLDNWNKITLKLLGN